MKYELVDNFYQSRVVGFDFVMRIFRAFKTMALASAPNIKPAGINATANAAPDIEIKKWSPMLTDVTRLIIVERE